VENCILIRTKWFCASRWLKKPRSIQRLLTTTPKKEKTKQKRRALRQSLHTLQKDIAIYDYYKEKAAFEGKPLPKNPLPLSTPQEQVVPKNPMPLSTPEPQHSLPKVIPDKINTPLLVYPYDFEGSNLNQILEDIKNGGAPVHKAHERKFIKILTELNKLELKYKNAGMDQHEAMVTIFIKYL